MRHVVAGAHDRALPIGSTIILELRHIEIVAIENFVFQENDRVGIADGGLQQAFGVGRV